eukprot:jgi/Bigna1/72230/fgenesh1_pg.19_\
MSFLSEFGNFASNLLSTGTEDNGELHENASSHSNRRTVWHEYKGPTEWECVWEGGVNVRENSSTDAMEVGSLDYGEKVVAVEYDGFWIKHGKGWTCTEMQGHVLLRCLGQFDEGQHQETSPAGQQHHSPHLHSSNVYHSPTPSNPSSPRGENKFSTAKTTGSEDFPNTQFGGAAPGTMSGESDPGKKEGGGEGAASGLAFQGFQDIVLGGEDMPPSGAAEGDDFSNLPAAAATAPAAQTITTTTDTNDSKFDSSHNMLNDMAFESSMAPSFSTGTGLNTKSGGDRIGEDPLGTMQGQEGQQGGVGEEEKGQQNRVVGTYNDNGGLQALDTDTLPSFIQTPALPDNYDEKVAPPLREGGGATQDQQIHGGAGVGGGGGGDMMDAGVEEPPHQVAAVTDSAAATATTTATTTAGDGFESSSLPSWLETEVQQQQQQPEGGGGGDRKGESVGSPKDAQYDSSNALAEVKGGEGNDDSNRSGGSGNSVVMVERKDYEGEFALPPDPAAATNDGTPAQVVGGGAGGSMDLLDDPRMESAAAKHTAAAAEIQLLKAELDAMNEALRSSVAEASRLREEVEASKKEQLRANDSLERLEAEKASLQKEYRDAITHANREMENFEKAKSEWQAEKVAMAASLQVLEAEREESQERQQQQQQEHASEQGSIQILQQQLKEAKDGEANTRSLLESSAADLESVKQQLEETVARLDAERNSRATLQEESQMNYAIVLYALSAMLLQHRYQIVSASFLSSWLTFEIQNFGLCRRSKQPALSRRTRKKRSETRTCPRPNGRLFFVREELNLPQACKEAEKEKDALHLQAKVYKAMLRGRRLSSAQLEEKNSKEILSLRKEKDNAEEANRELSCHVQSLEAKCLDYEKQEQHTQNVDDLVARKLDVAVQEAVAAKELDLKLDQDSAMLEAKKTKKTVQVLEEKLQSLMTAKGGDVPQQQQQQQPGKEEEEEAAIATDGSSLKEALAAKQEKLDALGEQLSTLQQQLLEGKEHSEALERRLLSEKQQSEGLREQLLLSEKQMLEGKEHSEALEKQLLSEKQQSEGLREQLLLSEKQRQQQLLEGKEHSEALERQLLSEKQQSEGLREQLLLSEKQRLEGQENNTVAAVDTAAAKPEQQPEELDIGFGFGDDNDDNDDKDDGKQQQQQQQRDAEMEDLKQKMESLETEARRLREQLTEKEQQVEDQASALATSSQAEAALKEQHLALQKELAEVKAKLQKAIMVARTLLANDAHEITNE